MPMQQDTADDLIRKIFALQRTLRCVTQHSADIGGPGVALQGVMRMVGEDGELRATELAAKLGIGPAGLSRHVAELEELGYVRRRQHPQDRRAYLISLTELGESVLGEAMQGRALLLQEALADWSEDQARLASSTLGTLADSLFTTIRRAPGLPGPTQTSTDSQEQTPQ